MQITTKGRYAINAMLDLSLEYNNKPITLSVISERQNISLSYLEQLFTKLRRNNLVKSIRGPGGGYMLNKLPEDISIVDIIEAVDENVDLRRCKGDSNCNKGKKCLSHVLWCDLSSQMRSFLKSINLKELIDKGNK